MNPVLLAKALVYRLPVLCVFSVIAIGITQAQAITGYEKQRGQMMLDQVKADLKNNYFDSSFHGVNPEAVFKEASEKIKNAQSNGQILGIIAQAVMSLDDSHTFFIPPDRATSTDYGWEMQVIGDDAFVSSVKEKSDAEAKGLKVGDQVHLVDGFQPARSNLWKLIYLYYALRPQPGMHVTVSSPGGQPRELEILAKVQTRKPIDLTNYADYMDLVRSSENEEAKRKKGHRFQEFGEDLLIWRMPGFNLEIDEVDRLMSKARAHKALILDLRGNQGGYEDTLLRMIGNLFDHDIKVADLQRRKETKPMTAKSRRENAFTGKLIVLIDSGSASSAEILARVVQLEKRGAVIGDVSSGAVMRSRVYDHELGVTKAAFYAISITDADLRMGDGKSLEKNGVTPDEIKLPIGADLASKSDPVLAYAARLAGVTIDAAKAGALFPPLKEKP
jgi:C-terminal processing protease CtpA/Prc